MSSSALAPMWTPPINESAELTQWSLYLVRYSEGMDPISRVKKIQREVIYVQTDTQVVYFLISPRSGKSAVCQSSSFWSSGAPQVTPFHLRGLTSWSLSPRTQRGTLGEKLRSVSIFVQQLLWEGYYYYSKVFELKSEHYVCALIFYELLDGKKSNLWDYPF
jgi:hypothetical protein